MLLLAGKSYGEIMGQRSGPVSRPSRSPHTLPLSQTKYRTQGNYQGGETSANTESILVPGAATCLIVEHTNDTASSTLQHARQRGRGRTPVRRRHSSGRMFRTSHRYILRLIDPLQTTERLQTSSSPANVHSTLSQSSLASCTENPPRLGSEAT